MILGLIVQILVIVQPSAILCMKLPDVNVTGEKSTGTSSPAAAESTVHWKTGQLTTSQIRFAQQ